MNDYDNNGAQTPIDKNSVSYDELASPVDDTPFVGTKKSRESECPNCSDLRVRIEELEEALRNATTLSTADTISNEIPEILKLEYSLPYQYVQQYMAAEYKEGKSKVWFSVEIDVKSKKVASARTGRISESKAN